MNVSEVTRWGGALPQLNPETNFTIEQIARNVGQSDYKIRALMERHGMQPDGKIGHSHAVTPGKAMRIKAFATASKQASADGGITVLQFAREYRRRTGEIIAEKTVTNALTGTDLITETEPRRIPDTEAAMERVLRLYPPRGQHIGFAKVAQMAGVPIASVREAFAQHATEFNLCEAWKGAALDVGAERRGTAWLFSPDGAEKLARLRAPEPAAEPEPAEKPEPAQDDPRKLIAEIKERLARLERVLDV